MKLRLAFAAIVIVCCARLSVAAETETPLRRITPANLAAFLKILRQDVNQTDTAFSQLAHTKLPLFDETGHPLGRRKIKDRRQTLIDLNETVDDFERRPQDLVVTMTVSDQTEELADEVYDLSQIAYDNDEEELALQLTDLLGHLNNDAQLLQAYALDLAARQEQALRSSEKHRRGPPSHS